MRTFLSLALVASATAFSGVAPPPMASKVAMSKVARTPELEMQASSKATVIGAAAVGGIVGVYLFHELQTGLICAAILAYASTTASRFGGVAESAGETAVKVYDKTLELNAQYDLLPKVSTRPAVRSPWPCRVIMPLSSTPSHLDPPPLTPASAPSHLALRPSLFPAGRPLRLLLSASLSSLRPCPVQLKSATDTVTTAASNLDKNYGAHANPAPTRTRHAQSHKHRSHTSISQSQLHTDALHVPVSCMRSMCMSLTPPTCTTCTRACMCPPCACTCGYPLTPRHGAECLLLRVATGFTSKIDEQLKISQAVDKAGSKINELKSSVTDKVEDLKSKATE